MLKRAWKRLRILCRLLSRSWHVPLWNVMNRLVLGRLRTRGLLVMTCVVTLVTQVLRQLLLGILWLRVMVTIDVLN